MNVWGTKPGMDSELIVYDPLSGFTPWNICYEEVKKRHENYQRREIMAILIFILYKIAALENFVKFQRKYFKVIT